MPVLLKGRAATIDEWLMAGEHLYRHGASLVVFCERGVRGFDSHTRNLWTSRPSPSFDTSTDCP